MCTGTIGMKMRERIKAVNKQTVMRLRRMIFIMILLITN